jgi:hypothetical protein
MYAVESFINPPYGPFHAAIVTRLFGFPAELLSKRKLSSARARTPLD